MHPSPRYGSRKSKTLGEKLAGWPRASIKPRFIGQERGRDLDTDGAAVVAGTGWLIGLAGFWARRGWSENA